MPDLLTELDEHVLILTLNRTQKHNAFDDALLAHFQKALDLAAENPMVRVIMLRANGLHFSAGADLGWMQRMADFTEDENIADAKALAHLLSSLHHSKKPTIAVVQGAAFGGGAGLVAACDIAIAADSTQFCFSEVKLGLIPAVISPYVVRAIGERAASWLFMSAEKIDARAALKLGLIHHLVPEEELPSHAHHYAREMAKLAPLAVQESKQLVATVAHLPIDDSLQNLTASLIAKKRASTEGKKGMHAFLNKKNPVWD
ncbi:MAG: enoyl-CoA hydratase/isomerase family protein [Gammaproteobacteria bacterium]|nr:enoyl-CoA hydratase/isomerase family protein [Gammaproteobacteria bacterium]